MDITMISPKGTKLKYAYFDSDMGYSAPVCNAKDLPALEEFFLGGKKASTKLGVQNPLEMSDVYYEYCEDADCARAQQAKFAPLCKELKCKYSDLVFFELLHWEADIYTTAEYEEAEEKHDEIENSVNKSFSLKGF